MSGLLEKLRHVFEGTDVTVIALDDEGLHVVTEPELMPRMKGWGDKPWVLCDDRGERVHRGRRMVARNTPVRLTGGSAPHKASSSGRVYVAGSDVTKEDEPFHSQEYFPHIFNLKWVQESSDES